MSHNGFAGRDELLGVVMKRRHEAVELPICGMTVRIRSLTEREVSRYQMRTVAKRGGFRTERMLDASRRLIVLCLVNQEGGRLFGDDETDWLVEWDSADTQCLYNACAKHCGIDTSDIEELVKNSEPMPAAASPTDSPDNGDG
jgi:hypothetical protein